MRSLRLECLLTGVYWVGQWSQSNDDDEQDKYTDSMTMDCGLIIF